jgi:hypothetical protein
VEFLRVAADLLVGVAILLIVAAVSVVVGIMLVVSDLSRRRRHRAEHLLPLVPTIADEAESWLRRQSTGEK